ncbi:hypothetical protein NSTCB13_02741 [Nostoc sp. DSM 114160]|jgi:hypothetical protein
MYNFSDIDKEILIKNKDKIQNKFQELCKLDDFQRTLSSGLQNKSSILRRRKLWGDLLEAAINE